MNTKIIKQEKNPFLYRDEIIIEIESKTAPSFDDVKKALGKDENLIVVKKVNGNFGKHLFNAEVLVYESEEAKNNIEVIPKKVRKKMQEEQKAAEEAKKKAAEKTE